MDDRGKAAYLDTLLQRVCEFLDGVELQMFEVGMVEFRHGGGVFEWMAQAMTETSAQICLARWLPKPRTVVFSHGGFCKAAAVKTLLRAPTNSCVFKSS